MSVENNTFPKYEMIVDGVSDFYILKDAGLLLGDNSKIVVFGKHVRVSERNTRKMKSKDKEWIKKICDEYEKLKSTKPMK